MTMLIPPFSSDVGFLTARGWTGSVFNHNDPIYVYCVVSPCNSHKPVPNSFMHYELIRSQPVLVTEVDTFPIHAMNIFDLVSI